VELSSLVTVDPRGIRASGIQFRQDGSSELLGPEEAVR
jgi:hypothetical protein